MPRIKALKFFQYSENGWRTDDYPPGEHEVSDNLAAFALDQGWAEIVDVTSETDEPDEPEEGKCKAQLWSTEEPTAYVRCELDEHGDDVQHFVTDPTNGDGDDITWGENDDDPTDSGADGATDDGDDITDDGGSESAPGDDDGTESGSGAANGSDGDQGGSDDDSDDGDTSDDADTNDDGDQGDDGEPGDSRSAQGENDTTEIGEGVAPPIDATPAARGKANELQLDLATVTGTGTDGRIGIEDVRKAAGLD